MRVWMLLLAILVALFGAVWALFTMPGATGSEDGLVYMTGSVRAAWIVAFLPLSISAILFILARLSKKKH